jgi:hypothetical protein
MGWPLSQDYNEAIQDPPSAFRDPELRGGELRLNPLGLPLPRSGNFADVYEVTCPATKSKWAVKCFTRQVPGLQERYSAVSRHLFQASLPFTVDFQFLDKGIRVRNQWYPILKMRWVEGFLFNEFVRDNLDKPALLQALQQIWVRLARRLRDAKIAHCDLQHGNVLLVPGSKAAALAVKLIDYDGMWVPALAQSKSGEVGHPNYQHPERLREGTYDLEVDRFPFLVTATALRALTVAGRTLWDRYDNGDNFLFKETDLQAPEESQLFHELGSVADPMLQTLLVPLREACRARLQETPLLGDLVPEEKQVEDRGSRAQVAPPPLPGAEAPAATDWNFTSSPALTAPGQPAQPLIRPRRRSGRGGFPGWAWLVAGLAVAAAFVTGLFLLMPPSNTEPGTEVAVVHPKTPTSAIMPPPPSTQLVPPPPTIAPPPTTAAPPRTFIPPPPSTAPPPATMVRPPPTTAPKPPPKTNPVVIIPTPVPRQKPDTRLAVPAEADCQTAEADLRERFKDFYTKKQNLLANALRGYALGNNRSPVDRYVCFQELRRLSVENRDAAAAMRWAMEIGARFKVDRLEVKAETAEALSKAAHDQQTAYRAIDQALKVCYQARGEDNYESAIQAVKAAQAAATKVRDAAAGSLLARLHGDLKREKEDFLNVLLALETLAKKPDDPEANLVVGRFRCGQQVWEEGLLRLTLGSDEVLRDLATRDIAEPTKAADRKALADAWNEQSKKEKDSFQAVCWRRAHRLYKLAEPGLLGLDQAAARSQLLTLAQKLPDLADRWHELDYFDAAPRGDLVLVEKGKWLMTRRWYRGAIDITAVARSKTGNIRLAAGAGGMVIFNVDKDGGARIHSPDREDPDARGQLLGTVLDNNPDVTIEGGTTWQKLRWQLTPAGQKLWANDKLVFESTTPCDLSAAHAVGVGTERDPGVEVRSLVVKVLLGVESPSGSPAQ